MAVDQWLKYLLPIQFCSAGDSPCTVGQHIVANPREGHQHSGTRLTATAYPKSASREGTRKPRAHGRMYAYLRVCGRLITHQSKQLNGRAPTMPGR